MAKQQPTPVMAALLNHLFSPQVGSVSPVIYQQAANIRVPISSSVPQDFTMSCLCVCFAFQHSSEPRGCLCTHWGGGHGHCELFLDVHAQPAGHRPVPLPFCAGNPQDWCCSLPSDCMAIDEGLVPGQDRVSTIRSLCVGVSAHQKLENLTHLVRLLGYESLAVFGDCFDEVRPSSPSVKWFGHCVNCMHACCPGCHMERIL